MSTQLIFYFMDQRRTEPQSVLLKAQGGFMSYLQD